MAIFTFTYKKKTTKALVDEFDLFKLPEYLESSQVITLGHPKAQVLSPFILPIKDLDK